MFSRKSCADEIAQSMENHLRDGAINKLAARDNQIVKAAEYLNAVAEIFDESGLSSHAEVITAVLESLAKKKDLKKKPVKKPAKKAPSSEKQVKNLKEKGWVFDESGAKDKNDAGDGMTDRCSACDRPYDMSAADPKDKEEEDAELYSMLDDFDGSSDFEDELDFDDFDDRAEVSTKRDPFEDFRRIYVGDDDL